MAKIDFKCRFCKKPGSIYKHCIGSDGHTRFRCANCNKTFQLDYTAPAHKDGIKDAGYNDGNARLRYKECQQSAGYLQKLKPQQVTHIQLNTTHIQLFCEEDEQWSYVEKRITSVGSDMPDSRGLSELSRTFRSPQSLYITEIIGIAETHQSSIFCTDNCSLYKSYLSKPKHITGKAYTQRIE